MKFGHFDDARKEYVIETPYTPLPWINYLGNEDFFGLISNTAGGYDFYKDAKMRRITRFRYNNVLRMQAVVITILKTETPSGIQDGSLFRQNLIFIPVAMGSVIPSLTEKRIIWKLSLPLLFQLTITARLIN